MLLATVVLRRLFTPHPTEGEMRFHWWFADFGAQSWFTHLRRNGFGPRSAKKIAKNQLRSSFKILETWDTEVFQAWKAIHVQDPLVDEPGCIEGHLLPTLRPLDIPKWMTTPSIIH